MVDDRAEVHSPSTYQYLPLNEGAGEIRILHLLPGSLSSPIRVLLESIPFFPETPPLFEALSYTWGLAENPVNIFVGPTGHTTLAVTQNLAEALPYLRLEDRLRTLWIDAICVNQDDVAERTSQVKRMADIFSKATRVIVWLGPASDDSPMAIDYFRAISQKFTLDLDTYSFRPTSADTRGAGSDQYVMLDGAQAKAIMSLLSRPWFDRLWIWQEVCLPPEDPIVMCGSQIISWSVMCHAVFYLLARHFSGGDPEVHELLTKRVVVISPLCDRNIEGYTPLTFLLDKTKHCECSDPRDRIFALLSLLDPDERVVELEPDYSKTISEVYKNATLCMMKLRPNLDIIAMAGFDESAPEIPSWVPKWPCRTIEERLRYNSQASGEALAEDLCYEAGEDVLHVTGVSVDVIDRAERVELPEYISASIIDIGHEIRRLAAWIDIKEPFQEDSKDLLVFCRTICNDFFNKRYHPPRRNAMSLKECLQALRLLLTSTIASWDTYFIDVVGQYICGRSLFVTKNGRLGLGPKATKPGDIVTVLLGGSPAFMLRPLDSGHHQLVGEAYCHGFMDAEALLSPLPKNVHFVVKWHEETDTYWPSHMDQETGELYSEDPRLGKLPPGWKRRQHSSDETWNWFVNEETGEQMKGHGDPRLVPEELKKRGVDLRVFKLV